jgi:hypothetical protein
VARLQIRQSDQIDDTSLEAVEFIRRFLLHILPSGFVKIRHFGFLANRDRATGLALFRQHLNASQPSPATVTDGQQSQSKSPLPNLRRWSATSRRVALGRSDPASLTSTLTAQSG